MAARRKDKVIVGQVRPGPEEDTSVDSFQDLRFHSLSSHCIPAGTGRSPTLPFIEETHGERCDCPAHPHTPPCSRTAAWFSLHLLHLPSEQLGDRAGKDLGHELGSGILESLDKALDLRRFGSWLLPAGRPDLISPEMCHIHQLSDVETSDRSHFDRPHALRPLLLGEIHILEPPAEHLTLLSRSVDLDSRRHRTQESCDSPSCLGRKL